MLQDKQNIIATIGEKSPLNSKLSRIYDLIKQHHPYISRIAVALYDSQEDLLKTFLYCAEAKTPLPWYQAKLSESPSLVEIAKSGQPRILNDISESIDPTKTHSKAIIEAGYCSSYTLPMIYEGHFFGFIFFNSHQPNVFTEQSAPEFDMVGCMITLLIYNEHSNINTLVATVKSAIDVTHFRDPETCTHLERMSRYARIITRELAPKYNFDDSFIEHVFLFAPLHDIGKINIPDSVLLKEGKLSDEEFEIMKKHVECGRELIDSLLSNFGLGSINYAGILRNIILYHHEYLDGSGYPYGLTGESIPIESKIVTTADIFDALTSRRPYKKAWTNQQAFDELRRLSQSKLDKECVEALISNQQAIIEIQSKFVENEFG
ncbi:HD domain-containing protein [Aliikangiella marina]|uniref:HD domain-containing protein n=1 Tax=Aliikangiella marina TaxID=1712262 RepID=A0A545T2Y7_9GAMM|nr:HD domain-containing phosphohydrolase [Aliikangiella marina]TQV71545.1 HD domain-containing protein [Aliikangiella marina]